MLRGRDAASELADGAAACTASCDAAKVGDVAKSPGKLLNTNIPAAHEDVCHNSVVAKRSSNQFEHAEKQTLN